MDAELCAALVDDLDQLIRLHDRELDADTLNAMRQMRFPEGLALLPDDEAGRVAHANMIDALAVDVPLDELAADFAAIYLNHAYGASPYESVWLSDDHLACAAPMFALRACYAEAGLRQADWRQRFDDHFVVQMQYLRCLLAQPAVNPKKLANFIDEHLGFWFADFARQVALRCAMPFYAALVELTHIWLIRFRDILVFEAGVPRPGRDELLARIQRKQVLEKADVAPLRFMPGGQGPSW